MRFRCYLLALMLTSGILLSLLGILRHSVGTALSATQILNGDFEAGSGVGWTEYSKLGYGLILIKRDLPVGVAPHGGSWAAWLGGDNGELAYLEQQVTISTATPVLGYWHWIDSEDSCGWDHARVLVNGSPVTSYSLCISFNTGTWAKKTVDLGTYAGQTVQLRLQVETDTSRPSGLYVDDVALEPGGSPTPTYTPPAAATSTATNPPTGIPTGTPTPTATHTPASTPTNTPTATHTPNSTPTSTSIAAATSTPTATLTSMPSDTPTATPPASGANTYHVYLPLVICQ